MAAAGKNNRKHYRLNYPPGERPKFKVKALVFDCLDISEEGIRLSMEGVAVPNIREGMPVGGVLDFNGRGTFPVKGEVVRVQEDAFAVKLKTPLPLTQLMAEQRYLIQKFKKV